jgi:putative chitinase
VSKPVVAAPPPKPVAPPAPTPFEPGDHKETLIKVAKKYGIKTDNDLASLLGQVGHETLNWTKSVENLRYTDPKRIYKLFTSAIPNEKAAMPYVNNPIALANVAYAGKNGNGDARSGDGWKYRGRGFLQVTGRANYQMVGQLAHPENPNIYVDNPDLLSTNPVESSRAASAYFIKRVGLGKSVKYATKQINPAGAGAKSRVAAVKQAKRSMSERLDKTTIHKLADKKRIKWDDEPAFLKLTKRITGHRYLDDLDQDGLFKMKNYLDRLDDSIHDPTYDIDETKKRKRKIRHAAYGPGPYGLYGVNTGYSGDGGGGDGGGMGENFADGKNPEDKGDSARHGIPKKASLSSLDKIGHGSGRKAQLARWQANMRRGRNKHD